ncbi:MAG: hypothetical protein ACKO5R_09780, partial [Planctomycetaceae bacterium]
MDAMVSATTGGAGRLGGGRRGAALAALAVGAFGAALSPQWCPAQDPAPPAAAAAAKPGMNDRQITLAVKSYLEREHFTKHPIDDEIAQRWFSI